MATNDNVYDLAASLEEDDIEFLLIAYTTFEEVYEVLLSSDNSPFDEDEDF